MTDMIRGPSALLAATKTQKAPTPSSAGRKMVSSFQQMFDEVNRDKLHADKMVTEMVAGRNKDIVGTVIAMEKSSVSTQMLLAVRNKVVSAYEEIMRMPV
jgi:flagellar hook-basal body complex protein FliE